MAFVDLPLANINTKFAKLVDPELSFGSLITDAPIQY